MHRRFLCRLLALSTPLWLVLLGAGCDDAGGDGGAACRSDNDCKGERICVSGACTDPNAPDMVADGGGDDALDTLPGDTAGDTTQGDTVPGDTAPDVPPECSEGALRCAAAGDVEACTGGRWTASESCSGGCLAGTCAMAGDAGTCGEPLVFGVGQTVISTTDTTYNPNVWSQDCTSRYLQQTGVSVTPVGPESVMRLDVSEAQMLRLTLRPLDPTYFALYLRSECGDPGSEIGGVCGGNAQPGESYVVESWFAAGQYYVFVDDFGDNGDGPGQFELTAEPMLLPQCGGQVPTVLDLSQPVELEADTALGNTSEDWNSPECAVIQSTAGAENIYVFAVPRRSEVSIAATPLEPADSQLAVYLRTACEDRFSQVACGYTAGNGSAVVQETLDAGTYYLFVDDFIGSIDEAQTYSLSIQAR